MGAARSKAASSFQVGLVLAQATARTSERIRRRAPRGAQKFSGDDLRVIYVIFVHMYPMQLQIYSFLQSIADSLFSSPIVS